MADVRIIDTSSNNGPVDWGAVLRSGVAGGIVKATEGLRYQNPTFPADWAALGQAKAVRGAYCFAHPDQDPVAQADYFLSYVAPQGLHAADILVLDLEVGTGNMDGFAWNWLVHVQAETNIRPWFYSYGPFIRSHLTDKRLASFSLWLAAYQPKPPAPPPPWTSIQLWQHTDSASIPGVNGRCDESVGTIAPVTEAQAMARVPNPVAAHHRPGAGPEQFAVMAADGAMYAFNGAPYCDAYNAHPDLGGAVRGGVDFNWDDDGWGWTQYFDDGAYYHLRAQGH